MKQHGFSLIEVLVALFILAFLGIAAGQSVFSALRSESRGDAARRTAAQIMIASAQQPQGSAREIDRRGLEFFSEEVPATQFDGDGVWLMQRWRDRSSGLVAVSAHHLSPSEAE